MCRGFYALATLFIKMPPLMAAKLTMCSGECACEDQSGAGRRCVWSPPNDLHPDLTLCGGPNIHTNTQGRANVRRRRTHCNTGVWCSQVKGWTHTHTHTMITSFSVPHLRQYCVRVECSQPWRQKSTVFRFGGDLYLLVETRCPVGIAYLL